MLQSDPLVKDHPRKADNCSVQRTNHMSPIAIPTLILDPPRSRHIFTLNNPGQSTCFGELGTPTNHSDSPDADFYPVRHPREVLQKSPSEVVSFSLELEVSECINSVKPHKASGPDAIEPERLIHSGESLKLHLTAVFNAIVVEEYIPKAFQLGMVIPISKGHNRDLFVRGNYHSFQR